MRALVVLTAAACALALLLGGTAPFGRVMLALGLPRLAVPAFSDLGWRGVAHYRAGEMGRAAEAFREARAFYNLGNAQARRAEYAAALESYDIALASGDADAQANFDVVAAFYAGLRVDAEALALFEKRESGPAEDSHIARGNARASGTGDEVTNNNTMLGLAQLDSRGRQGVRRVFDDKFILADDRWLQQLADVPGEYLSARIAHERKRRAGLGLAPPEPEDPR